MLIVNADDWGRSRPETDLALACWRRAKVNSVSAMVFMEDSERAAELAAGKEMDVGLHINFSQSFTGRISTPSLRERHERVARFLAVTKYARILYNPVLRGDFIYDYEAQAEEFNRLYGRPPSHFDGHQHMHLCTNMLLSLPIPRGARVRRNFSFSAAEKDLLNRSYRRIVDMWLARRYRLTDFFFALSQNLEIPKMRRIIELARHASVELMTHPIKSAEYASLTGGVPPPMM